MLIRPLPPVPAVATVSALIEKLKIVGFSSQRLAESFLIKNPTQALARLSLLANMKNRKVHELESLFILGWPCEGDVIRKSLGTELTRQLMSEGLLEEQMGQCKSTFLVLEFLGVFVIADRLDAQQSGHKDFVMAPSYSTAKLATLLEKPSLSFHEAGCGSGLLGLLAMKCGSQASFSDLNPRACEFTRLNLNLNKLKAEVSVKDWKRAFVEMEGEVLFIFNTPSLPDVSARKLMVSHVGDQPNIFVKDLVSTWSASSKNKKGLFWVCLCLEDGFDTPEAMLQAWTAVGGLKFSFQLDADSPFALTEKQIKNKTLPMPCWLVEERSEEVPLFSYLEKYRVSRVISGILSLEFTHYSP